MLSCNKLVRSFPNYGDSIAFNDHNIFISKHVSLTEKNQP